MSKKGKPFFQYSEESLLHAIKAVHENKISIRQASRDFSIPYGTLHNKLNCKVPITRKMGPSTVLTGAEEELLVNWIIANAKKGFPLKRCFVADSVQNILQEDRRETPFTNSRPGRKWFLSFLKRHPEITERYAENINSARAGVTEITIRTWFSNLHKYIEEEKASSIFSDPSRILNSDETGFRTCPKTGKVLGPVGFDNFYEVKSGNEKESISVLATFSADGKVAPPLILYPLQRISREISQNVNPEWSIARSKRGWMTGPIYYEYIVNVFHPWLKKNNIKLPVLLLVDGHKSHLSYHASKFCAGNGIFQVALYPNATHILQPADVAVFKPLKSWEATGHQWKRKTNNQVVTKAVFGSLLDGVFREKATVQTIQNGFRKCSLFPFNPNAVDFSECMSNDIRTCPPLATTTKETDSSLTVQHLLFLESLMKKGRAEEFRLTENSDWIGDLEAKALFVLWKKVRTLCGVSSLTNDFASSSNSSEHKVANSDCSLEVIAENTQFQCETYDTTAISRGEIICASENTVANTDSSLEVMGEKTQFQGETNDATAISRGEIICPLKESQRSNEISPSFANHIRWPSSSPYKSSQCRNTAARSLPLATTSKEWLSYHKEQDHKKKEKEREKKERIEKRMAKRKALTTKTVKKLDLGPSKAKRKKKALSVISSENERDWEPSGDSLDDVSLDEDENDIDEWINALQTDF